PPFGRSTRVATAGDHFFLARQSTYQIERYTSEGKLDRLVRRSFTPRRVNRGHIDAFKRKRLASPGEPRRSIDARLLAEVPFPETFPPHGQIRVDSEGYIWVQDDPIPGAVRNRSGPCSRPRGACSARCASHETSRSSRSVRTTFWGSPGTTTTWRPSSSIGWNVRSERG